MKKEKSHLSAAPQNLIKDIEKPSKNQLFAVRNSFLEYPKSMREVACELNEERSNICWYVGMLRDSGQIQVHHKGICHTTSLMVNFYTTDQKLFSQNLQLSFLNDLEAGHE